MKINDDIYIDKERRKVIYTGKEAEKIQKAFQRIGKLIEQDKESFRKDYEKYLKTIEHYLINEGIPIPVLVEEAYQKFISEIIGDDSDRPLQQADIIKMGVFLKREYDKLIDSLSGNKKQIEKPKSNRGNPVIKDSKIDMPEGFYKEADRLKKEHPDRPKSWYNLKLREKYYNGDESKKSTVYRRLTKYWEK